MDTNFIKMSNLHIILLVIIIELYCNTNGFECKQQISVTKNKILMNATYDLCELVISDTYPGYYATYDPRGNGNWEDNDATNYTYYFNIGANVALQVPDEVCDDYTGIQSNNGYCDNIRSEGLSNATCREEDIKPISTMVAAYQAKGATATSDAACMRLHDGVQDPVWTFLDESDPAAGVKMTYINGDWCDPAGKNRDFTIIFKCSPDIRDIPTYFEPVLEPIGEICSYELTMETYKGCPIECVMGKNEITGEDALCSGQGRCDYDWNLGSAKCFCYKGYYGQACSQQSDPDLELVYEDSDNSYVGALVVVILLLLVILFILGYLFLRYTRIKNQPFDFKFLQQTKKKRAKVAGDEYDEE